MINIQKRGILNRGIKQFLLGYFKERNDIYETLTLKSYKIDESKQDKIILDNCKAEVIKILDYTDEIVSYKNKLYNQIDSLLENIRRTTC